MEFTSRGHSIKQRFTQVYLYTYYICVFMCVCVCLHMGRKREIQIKKNAVKTKYGVFRIDYLLLFFLYIFQFNHKFLENRDHVRYRLVKLRT